MLWEPRGGSASLCLDLGSRGKLRAEDSPEDKLRRGLSGVPGGNRQGGSGRPSGRRWIHWRDETAERQILEFGCRVGGSVREGGRGR